LDEKCIFISLSFYHNIVCRNIVHGVGLTKNKKSLIFLQIAPIAWHCFFAIFKKLVLKNGWSSGRPIIENFNIFQFAKSFYTV